MPDTVRPVTDDDPDLNITPHALIDNVDRVDRVVARLDLAGADDETAVARLPRRFRKPSK